MRTARVDTKNALKAAVRRAGSYRKLAVQWGIEDVNPFIAMVSRILNDRPVSALSENVINRHLGLPLSDVVVDVKACPTCYARHGIVVSHADGLDCHGRGGSAVLLHNGERIVRERAKHEPGPLKWGKYPSLHHQRREDLAWSIKNRIEITTV